MFTTKVWPQVGRYLFPQHRGLTPAEGAPGLAADVLDRVGGIDYLVDTGVGLLPMSTRVQPDRGYRTVTVSAGQAARLQGPAWAAAPALYLHAYVDPGGEQPAAVLWVWALDLVTALATAPAVHGPDGTTFWAVGT
ncbi:MAG TPA: hypothetical protein VMM13_09400, partial [Euzebya sp.]|nr:hypothetical protein [Euzebya sp.]